MAFSKTGWELIAEMEDKKIKPATQPIVIQALHPWPEDKRGGSDPDICPECGKDSHIRQMKWDAGRWRRMERKTITCSRCEHEWEPEPIDV